MAYRTEKSAVLLRFNKAAVAKGRKSMVRRLEQLHSVAAAEQAAMRSIRFDEVHGGDAAVHQRHRAHHTRLRCRHQHRTVAQIPFRVTGRAIDVIWATVVHSSGIIASLLRGSNRTRSP